jgi:hypothetical protein
MDGPLILQGVMVSLLDVEKRGRFDLPAFSGTHGLPRHAVSAIIA